MTNTNVIYLALHLKGNAAADEKFSVSDGALQIFTSNQRVLRLQLYDQEGRMMIKLAPLSGSPDA